MRTARFAAAIVVTSVLAVAAPATVRAGWGTEDEVGGASVMRSSGGMSDCWLSACGSSRVPRVGR